MEEKVAINKDANAQSRGAPVKRLCENGVVNVQPAIVLVKSAVLLT